MHWNSISFVLIHSRRLTYRVAQKSKPLW